MLDLKRWSCDGGAWCECVSGGGDSRVVGARERRLLFMCRLFVCFVCVCTIVLFVCLFCLCVFVLFMRLFCLYLYECTTKILCNICACTVCPRCPGNPRQINTKGD